jgi:hypothetical protein
MMDANTLINANYYIADQPTRNGIAQMSDNISLNQDGQYVLKHDTVPTGVTLNPYHIKYGEDVLSPLALMAQIMLEKTGKSVEDMFKEQLMNNDALLKTYTFLYHDKPKGNGLRFLIFVNDSCVPFIHIVCEYISSLFGEDLMFIDRQYRNDIKGTVQYVGNKQKAVQVINELRDYQMLKGIIDLASNFKYGYGDMTNLEQYFNAFTVPQLFYVYEKIFPTEPLAPGNYTKEHMIYIITRKLAHAFPQTNTVENLMIPSFADMSALYNNISDEELMSIHE